MNSEISTVLSAVPSCQKKKEPGLRGCIYNYIAFRNERTIIIQQEVAAARTAFCLIVTYSYRRRCFSDMVYVTPNN